jgi:hypothetical protein
VISADTSPRSIFVIRHGEKPPDSPPPHGVDVDGDHDKHSLITRGWQRAGALATLFAPRDGPLRAGLKTPTQLIAPAYPKAAANERTHQTIQPLANLLNLPIQCDIAEGHETRLGKTLAAVHTGVTLVCWEHTAIPTIGTNICPAGPIPSKWPGDRFDVVWSFTLDPDTSNYRFEQFPQLLLAGDIADPIVQSSDRARGRSGSLSMR